MLGPRSSFPSSTPQLLLEHQDWIAPDHRDPLHQLLEDLGELPTIPDLIGACLPWQLGPAKRERQEVAVGRACEHVCSAWGAGQWLEMLSLPRFPCPEVDTGLQIDTERVDRSEGIHFHHVNGQLSHVQETWRDRAFLGSQKVSLIRRNFRAEEWEKDASKGKRTERRGWGRARSTRLWEAQPKPPL